MRAIVHSCHSQNAHNSLWAFVQLSNVTEKDISVVYTKKKKKKVLLKGPFLTKKVHNKEEQVFTILLRFQWSSKTKWPCPVPIPSTNTAQVRKARIYNEPDRLLLHMKALGKLRAEIRAVQQAAQQGAHKGTLQRCIQCTSPRTSLDPPCVLQTRSFLEWLNTAGWPWAPAGVWEACSQEAPNCASKPTMTAI